MATKTSTVYSTNPKMDTSGVSAASPVYGKLGNQIGSKPKSGGYFYEEAVSEQAGEYGMGKVNTCDHAFDIVGKDTMYMPDKVDVVKAGAKAIKKMSK